MSWYEHTTAAADAFRSDSNAIQNLLWATIYEDKGRHYSITFTVKELIEKLHLKKVYHIDHYAEVKYNKRYGFLVLNALYESTEIDGIELPHIYALELTLSRKKWIEMGNALGFEPNYFLKKYHLLPKL